MKSLIDSHSRTILGIGAPVMLSAATANVLLVIDTATVGHYSALSLAAIGVVGSILQMFLMIGTSMSIGLQAAIAQSLGAQDQKRSGLYAQAGLLFSLLLGVVLLIVLVSILPFVMNFLHLRGELREEARKYVSIAQFSILFHYPSDMIRAMLGAHRRTRPIFAASAITAIVNLSLDYGLIFGNFGLPRLGTAGAAWASFAGYAGAAFFLGPTLWKSRRAYFGTIRYRLQAIIHAIPPVVNLGISTTVEWGLWNLSMFFLNKYIVPCGSVPMALFYVTFRIQALFMIAMRGLSRASLTLTASSFGARSYHEVHTWKNRTLRLALIFSSVGVVACMLFPYQLLALFMKKPEIAILTNARLILLFSGVLIMVRSINMVYSASLRSMGNALYFTSTLFCSFVVIVSLGYLFVTALGWGITGALCALLCDEVSRNVVNHLWFNSFVNRLVRLKSTIPSPDSVAGARIAQSVAAAAPDDRG
jgi:putative MATE family efflux protein